MLEKNYVEGCSSEEAEILAVRALLDIVESGAKSIEMAVRLSPSALPTAEPPHVRPLPQVMRRGTGMSLVSEERISALVAQIEAEKAAEAEAAGGAAPASAAGSS